MQAFTSGSTARATITGLMTAGVCIGKQMEKRIIPLVRFRTRGFFMLGSTETTVENLIDTRHDRNETNATKLRAGCFTLERLAQTLQVVCVIDVRIRDDKNFKTLEVGAGL